MSDVALAKPVVVVAADADASRSGRQLSGAGSDAYGSYSSHYDDCDNGISIGLLLTALLGIGVMFFTLFTKITMAGKRRKRSVREEIEEDVDPVGMMLDRFQEFALGGKHALLTAVT